MSPVQSLTHRSDQELVVVVTVALDKIIFWRYDCWSTLGICFVK